MIKKLLIITLFFSSVMLSPNSYALEINDNLEEIIVESSIFQDNSQNGPDFTISPNPSSSKLNIKLKRINETTTLTVFDVLGKKILSKELDQLNTTVDVSRWNNGVYLVRLTSDKETQTKRFVKQ